MKKMPVIFALITLVTAVFIGAAHVWRAELPARSVLVTGADLLPVERVIQIASIQAGTQVEAIDLAKLEATLRKHSIIADVQVTKVYPRDLQISVRERNLIANVNGRSDLYLDDKGVLVKIDQMTRLPDLPIVSGVPLTRSTEPGRTLAHPMVSEVLTVLSTAKKIDADLPQTISEIQIRNLEEIVIYASESGTPIIFGIGEAVSKLERLNAFWNQVAKRRGANQLEYIDLRFADQVVVRWNTAKI